MQTIQKRLVGIRGVETGVVNFDYSYVSNESNIYRKTFDHCGGGAYNWYSDVLGRLGG